MHTGYGYLATMETRHKTIRHHNFIKLLQRLRHKNEQLLMANWLEAKLTGGEVTSSLRNELRIRLSTVPFALKGFSLGIPILTFIWAHWGLQVVKEA